MLTTCNKCIKAHYCINCAKREECFWLTVCPPTEDGERISCEAFECIRYEQCRKLRVEDRPTRTR